MRATFVHEANLKLRPGGNDRTPGAAVTVALCGHWEHEPPCRVPHRTDVVSRDGDEVVIRVLFACSPAGAEGVRFAIADALQAGALPSKLGESKPTRWDVVAQHPAAVAAHEEALAQRLAAGPTLEQ